MLTQIGIGGFRSYQDARLKLAPLTVLIGANASGKSNAIEALRLLSLIASGAKVSSMRAVAHALGARPLRGNATTLGFRRADRFTLCCSMADREWDGFAITLRTGEGDELHIVDERITGTGKAVPLYEVVESSTTGGDLRVAYNNFARGGKKPQVTCNDQVTLLLQLESSARFESGHRAAQNTIPEICRSYQESLGKVVFLDPQPQEMRWYSANTERFLVDDGSNLSGVLFNLCEDGYESEILDIIRSLPEQNISAISFIETPRGEVMVELEETFGGDTRKYDASLLSDGTLRVLSVAAAILSARSGSLVVIEEIDNGVHPSRARTLLDSISRIAKRRDLRVLISSHNPALLDALPDDAVPHVVFCYRDPEDGSSRLVSLEDVPDYPELMAQGSIGHLMTRGLIDRFVKSRQDPETRREKARAWLQTLHERTEEP
ncbi:MAG: ATP-binding protein [Alphaproteobacteria bacterium]|nr:ATP-binding protein [Alphaproteobacteria bacterium]